MRRRLRKKKRLGEFREFGFEVNATLHVGLAASEDDAFWDRWITLVEARRLTFGGGCPPGGLSGFVAHDGRGTATEDDREAVRLFFEDDVAVASHTVGALIDAWHGK